MPNGGGMNSSVYYRFFLSEFFKEWESPVDGAHVNVTSFLDMVLSS